MALLHINLLLFRPVLRVYTLSSHSQLRTDHDEENWCGDVCPGFGTALPGSDGWAVSPLYHSLNSEMSLLCSR